MDDSSFFFLALISSEEVLKQKGVRTDRMDPSPAQEGSFEL
jgi:hypothetical protein